MQYLSRTGGFLKWWYPTTMGFPTKNDHFGVFWGYHHLRKHPTEEVYIKIPPDGPKSHVDLFTFGKSQGCHAECINPVQVSIYQLSIRLDSRKRINTQTIALEYTCKSSKHVFLMLKLPQPHPCAGNFWGEMLKERLVSQWPVLWEQSAALTIGLRL